MPGYVRTPLPGEQLRHSSPAFLVVCLYGGIRGIRAGQRAWGDLKHVCGLEHECQPLVVEHWLLGVPR